MVDIWESVSGLPGADDRQLPATAKLPALIACYTGATELHAVAESAIRVTSNNDFAVAFGLAATDMIECAVQTGDIEASVAAGKNSGSAEVGKLLDDALARRKQTAEEATSHFGMACDLDYGLPSVTHNAVTASGFEDAIRRNIYAGGDNCGRAIILGAIAGACYGVGGASGIPQAWLDKTSVIDRAQSLIAQLS